MKKTHPKVSLEVVSRSGGRSAGEAMAISAGFAPTPFGQALLAESPMGICHLSFLAPGNERLAWKELIGAWPENPIHRDAARAAVLAGEIFQEDEKSASPAGFRIFVRGTDFQIKVWRALLEIPLGATVSYGQIAASIGRPAATRATGTAIGKNEVAWLIPCHRVIRGDGSLGNFGWGPERKRAMLEWERVRTQT